MPEPNGWDDPREKQDTGDARRRSLLGAPDDVPSPRILKLALVAAAIIVVIALILYFKARKAPPALHNDLRITPSSLNACDISMGATSNRESWLPGAPEWKRELTESKQQS
ncbi:MAG TPA: hypothetical protein VGR72_06175 [Candidatus Acidoferrales bacterium]|nr:hypothetical protein [Candidatus Acidoferrales bacterium]